MSGCCAAAIRHPSTTSRRRCPIDRRCRVVGAVKRAGGASSVVRCATSKVYDDDDDDDDDANEDAKRKEARRGTTSSTHMSPHRVHPVLKRVVVCVCISVAPPMADPTLRIRARVCLRKSEVSLQKFREGEHNTNELRQT